MILLYFGTVQSLLILCLLEWSTLTVDGVRLPCDRVRLPCDGARLPCDRVRLPCDGARLPCDGVRLPCGPHGRLTSSGLEPSKAGSSLLQRFRRGTTSVNITRQGSQPSLLPNESVCPYKVFSEGKATYKSLCFRTMARDFLCDQRSCHLYRSGRSLLANVLRNSSVLLQWQPPALHKSDLKGFFINCSWNGTYTRFQCDSVQLGINCKDYLLTNVHDNVKYRICLQTLYTNRTSIEECVDFVVEPVGMQDIVIAMTAVGGSICVMLVIICLLVAYITENLMYPTFMHPSSKRGP
ncbi:fibronectin type III domain-containing protein 10 [Rana temporaria]|uniref:fibronectin type III domain-containing protein 10 n=1 Tax=Rana temporaria TaxID=8407 RepID=UPI001AADAB9C|nr:fibronectin type III domain-containing protein 10 [Rana temporaria]